MTGHTRPLYPHLILVHCILATLWPYCSIPNFQRTNVLVKIMVSISRSRGRDISLFFMQGSTLNFTLYWKRLYIVCPVSFSKKKLRTYYTPEQCCREGLVKADTKYDRIIEFGGVVLLCQLYLDCMPLLKGFLIVSE